MIVGSFWKRSSTQRWWQKLMKVSWSQSKQSRNLWLLAVVGKTALNIRTSLRSAKAKTTQSSAPCKTWKNCAKHTRRQPPAVKSSVRCLANCSPNHSRCQSVSHCVPPGGLSVSVDCHRYQTCWTRVILSSMTIRTPWSKLKMNLTYQIRHPYRSTLTSNANALYSNKEPKKNSKSGTHGFNRQDLTLRKTYPQTTKSPTEGSPPSPRSKKQGPGHSNSSKKSKDITTKRTCN